MGSKQTDSSRLNSWDVSARYQTASSHLPHFAAATSPRSWLDIVRSSTRWFRARMMLRFFTK